MRFSVVLAEKEFQHLVESRRPGPFIMLAAGNFQELEIDLGREPGSG
jgi:hypothetical protein